MKNIYPLQHTRAWRTYTGGSRLEAFFGQDNMPDGNYPEEWILSAVEARNAGRPRTKPPEGMSMLRDVDMSFKELLESEPERLLGKSHTEQFGASPGVLVKLIDAAERLTIQVHPTPEMAKKLFDSQFGKTECWHILDRREINGEKPCIYFGFKPGITKDYWKEVFDRQAIPAMLDCLHCFEVEPGDTFLIEGGIPHAIGAGCFLVEIQEPTDYTIRTERMTPAGLAVPDEGCHQGLGFERMFDCFIYDGLTREETERRGKIVPDGDCLVSYERSKCFELKQFQVENDIDLFPKGHFMGLFVLDGAGVVSEGEQKYNITKGDQLFVAASSAKLNIRSDKKIHILAFEGPR